MMLRCAHAPRRLRGEISGLRSRHALEKLQERVEIRAYERPRAARGLADLVETRGVPCDRVRVPDEMAESQQRAQSCLGGWAQHGRPEPFELEGHVPQEG